MDLNNLLVILKDAAGGQLAMYCVAKNAECLALLVYSRLSTCVPW